MTQLRGWIPGQARNKELQGRAFPGRTCRPVCPIPSRRRRCGAAVAGQAGLSPQAAGSLAPRSRPAQPPPSESPSLREPPPSPAPLRLLAPLGASYLLRAGLWENSPPRDFLGMRTDRAPEQSPVFPTLCPRPLLLRS